MKMFFKRNSKYLHNKINIQKFSALNVVIKESQFLKGGRFIIPL